MITLKLELIVLEINCVIVYLYLVIMHKNIRLQWDKMEKNDNPNEIGLLNNTLQRTIRIRLVCDIN